MHPFLLSHSETIALTTCRRCSVFRPAQVSGVLMDISYEHIGADIEVETTVLPDKLIPVTVQSVLWVFPEDPLYVSGWSVLLEMKPPSPELIIDLAIALVPHGPEHAIDLLFFWFMDLPWLLKHGAATLDLFRERAMSQPVVVLLAPLAITVLPKERLGESRIRLFNAVRDELVRRHVEDLPGLLAGLEP